MERMKYLTVSEAQRLKESVYSSRDRAMVGLLLHTGMRIGELAALQVRDFDPEARTVRIERISVHTPFIIDRAKGTYRVKAFEGEGIYSKKKPLVVLMPDGTSHVTKPEDLPKLVIGFGRSDFVKLGTKAKGAAGRVVPMVDADVWTYIEAERHGRDGSEWMWIAGPQNGRTSSKERMTYIGVRDVIVRAMKRAQLPREKCHPHVLRHTFAVHHLSNGMDLRTVMRIGGWSSMEVVARYLDLVTSDLIKVAERVHVGY